MELRRFFERALRSSFADLTLRDDGTVDYLSDLLTRFVRVERFHPRGLAVPRLACQKKTGAPEGRAGSKFGENAWP